MHCQQRMQNDTTNTFQVIDQSQCDHANDSLIGDVPAFDGNPELYFDLILKVENIAAVTKYNPKALALGIVQGAVINCL